ncbi:MAG: amidohydrolase family protein [Candidatus Altiarchaeota archaeon]
MVVEGKVLDLAILDANTPGSLKTSDICIKDGLIRAVGKASDRTRSIDAAGMMTVPGFVNIHTHLDKAGLLSRMKPGDFGKSLEENRELLKKFKRDYTVNEVMGRAGKIVGEMVVQGTTAIRTQVDVDTTAGLKGVEALTRLKEEFKNTVRIQLCAFPQEGVLKKGCEDLINQALESGADLMGGLPLVEKTREEQEQHLDVLFEIAVRHGCDLEVQVDESNNPQDFMLPLLAEKTIENKWQGRVSATHCISLSAVDDGIAGETIRLVKEAGMNVIVTPSANMITRHNVPDGVHARPSNSITRVRELLDAGVNVAVGTDNIRDVFYPLGNGSMLREMHVLASATRMTGSGDDSLLFDMASVNGARIMGLGYGVKEGSLADLIVLNYESTSRALNGIPHVRYVVNGGRVVSENSMRNTINGDELD